MLNLATETDRPDISIAGLHIWISGRQFEHLHDYWDGNWLNVRVVCETSGAIISAAGPIIHLRELVAWLDQLRECYVRLSGRAELACLEPNLNARISLEAGRGELVVDITPEDPEEHHMTFPIDQSFLPKLIRELEIVIERFPVRGA